jgi:hypothetical protein
VVLQSVEVGLPAADYRPEVRLPVRLPVEPLRLSLPTARHGVVPAGRELPERNSAPARRTVAVWAMGEPDVTACQRDCVPIPTYAVDSRYHSRTSESAAFVLPSRRREASFSLVYREPNKQASRSHFQNYT